MSRKKIATALVLLCGLFGASGLAQNARGDAERQRLQDEYLKRQIQRDLAERKAALDRNSKIVVEPRQPDVRPQNLRREERELREKFVAPHRDDLELYEDFLNEPRTGIFRLFPDHDCLADGVVRADGNCGKTFPGTWFYSFRKKEHSDGLLFDLQLRDEKLVTDGLLSQGILAGLGNFSLARVNLETPGVKFALYFQPAEKSLEVKEQYDRIGRGIEADGFRYSREVPVRVGEVYLLRVIAYRLQNKFVDELSRGPRTDAKMKLLVLENDERTDLTVAFRIIRKDADGNLTIIWKELDKKKSPEIVFGVQ
ncbi:MAG: hypothetical protein R2747_23435 [Pyrinomonadaceae bacterium]